VTTIGLTVSLATILIAAYLFTNAVEILGDRLGLSQGGVGSVLAAVGTALPETIIPIVAILGAVFAGRDPHSAGEIGIGAILGAPFMLATLAMFVVGMGILGYRHRREAGARVEVDDRIIGRDVGFFFVAFAVAAGVGLLDLAVWADVLVAVLLVAAYVLHAVQTLRSGGGLEDVPERLTFWHHPLIFRAPMWAIIVQFVGALVLMVVGAHLFVGAIEQISEALGMPAGLISLILAPLATELPEKFNSVLWVRNGKDTLALGNITGAMVFQSTIPVAIGIVFTDWNLTGLSLLSAILALLSGGFIYSRLMRKQHIRDWHLLVGGLYYALFVVATVFAVLLG
jgi:cation:H+ antiporter